MKWKQMKKTNIFVQFRGFNFHLFEVLHPYDNTSDVSRYTKVKLLRMTSESKKKTD